VDECGHAMEPTALVPIAGLLGPKHKPSQIVLSGDPLQLGPVVRSPVAQHFHLGISLLGRLMDTVDLYKRDSSGNYNPKVLTKLVANYRSHAEILKVPNELFYDGELTVNNFSLQI
jgi:helicase MOV-10